MASPLGTLRKLLGREEILSISFILFLISLRISINSPITGPELSKTQFSLFSAEKKLGHGASKARIELNILIMQRMPSAKPTENALVHRDYNIIGSEIHIDMDEDRLEIVSPGGMFDGKNIQEVNFNKIASIQRNPIPADILSRLDYMERRGSGLTE